MSNPFITVWEEHQFWLKILEDHAIFIHDYLAPQEQKWVVTAAQYILAFSQLRRELERIDPRLPVSSDQMITFAREVFPVACGYFQLEGELQRLRIRNEVNLNLTPAYLNGTLSENEEYLRLLGYFVRGEEAPILDLSSLLDLWLTDQAGHAYLLVNGLDISESTTIERATFFIQKFRSFIFTNRQMTGSNRFTPPVFPAQSKFAVEVAETVLAFNQLVMQVVSQYKLDQILTRLTLRFIVHHFPEACYFLRKLAHYLPETVRMQLPPCQFEEPYFPTLTRSAF